MNASEERNEIVFFDVETTIPWKKGQGYSLLEFGAILVCPQRLLELHCYSTLVKPADLSSITISSVRCNGITKDSVATAPSFAQVADVVYDILHGRVWAGHNIVKFDCVRIREAFAEIGHPDPEPKGIIDTLTLLTERFGRRAGNMKMATLATYFGLGAQAHRSLDDVRMNLEVVKCCSTVLFLESSLPNIFTTNSWVSPNTTSRSQSNKKGSHGERDLNMTPSALMFEENLEVSPLNNPEAEVLPTVDCNRVEPDPFDMGSLIDQIEAEPKQPDTRMDEIDAHNSPEVSANVDANEVCSGYAGMLDPDEVLVSSLNANEGCSGYAGMLDPDEVSVSFLSASLVPSYWGPKIKLLHKDVFLQLCCTKLRVRFGVSTKFIDSAGRPRLSIVVDSPSSLCQVLDVCDHLAQRLSLDSGSNSVWRPVVIRKNGFLNSSTIRLNIPTISNGSHGSSSIYTTEIYQKDASNTIQRLVLDKFDATQLDFLFVPGAFVDAFFSLDVYDYQQHAGIRLVAKKLIINRS